MLIAFWDTEANGLLREADRMHCLGIIFSDGRELSCADQPGYVPIATGRKALYEADLLVAHNGDDYDIRLTKKLNPQWDPPGETLDTLILSKLLFPMMFRQGPNNHKLPPAMRSRHSLEAWGMRLGAPKDDYSHRKAERLKREFPEATPAEITQMVWGTWDPEMSSYMMQDCRTLKRLFAYLMSLKPTPEAVTREHKFSSIIRRQEAWGFTFDHVAALDLQGKLTTVGQALEASLIKRFGEWWAPGPVTVTQATRKEKLTGFPDVTQPRIGKTGKALRPYVGPPLCHWEKGAKYTPVVRTEFKPSSRDHVRLMLGKLYGWKPTKFTEKGTPQVDDDVLRGLPYPEAPELADFYAAEKIRGYVSGGNKAWLKTARQEGGEWRQHGRVNTVGTYTFRCSHSDPNLGQVPTRDPTYGHLCRALFLARRGFRLVGWDGSGMQLRLLAHHLAKYDGGRYAQVFAEGFSPHAFMRDAIGTDLMGEGDEGKVKGKTLNYALCFGGGERKLGSIIEPAAPDRRKIELGKLVKERMGNTFGDAFDDLKSALKRQVEARGYIVGLDHRKAPCSKPHAALATLLQMGEAIVMRESLILLDDRLQSLGLIPGVDPAGNVREECDYEFAANVHDEAQADVRPIALETYCEAALWCVPEAGLRLNLQCPIKSDVKVGDTWQETH